MTKRLTTAQLKAAFAERDRRLAAYAAMHWKVYRCIYCGKSAFDASWHPECEQEETL